MSHLTLNKNPEVSVVMSCYNASRWLHKAVDSVLAQTFEDFEFILVDDGSSDETWSIIQSYRDKDRRIVAISKKNTGQADSRNMAISIARGSWIAILDADDVCRNNRLQMQVDYVRKNRNIALLGSGFVEIDENGQAIMEHQYPNAHQNLVRRLERLQGFFPHSSSFFQADLFRHLGGYKSRVHRAEDWRLMLAMASVGQIGCLSEPLVQIRKHSNQTSP